MSPICKIRRTIIVLMRKEYVVFKWYIFNTHVIIGKITIDKMKMKNKIYGGIYCSNLKDSG